MKKQTILDKIAKRIRELRQLKEWSQEELAEKADLHPTFIGNIERAEKNSTITTLEKIAQALSISLPELLSFPDDQLIASANAKTLTTAYKLLEIAKELAASYEKEKKKSKP